MRLRIITTIVLAAAVAAASTPLAAQDAVSRARLRNPAAMKEAAPAEYKVAFDTTAGPFVIAVHRAWAPKGADRFYNLVKNGFYDGCGFFRVIPGFMAQFGVNGTPAIQSAWNNANITDDPVKQSNRRGTISFATAGANTRTTQVFVNFKNNAGLDGQGFAPFGEVVSGMEIVDKLYGEYGDRSNQQELIKRQGNAYLRKSYPKLDYIKTARLQK